MKAFEWLKRIKKAVLLIAIVLTIPLGLLGTFGNLAFHPNFLFGYLFIGILVPFLLFKKRDLRFQILMILFAFLILNALSLILSGLYLWFAVVVLKKPLITDFL